MVTALTKEGRGRVGDEVSAPLQIGRGWPLGIQADGQASARTAAARALSITRMKQNKNCRKKASQNFKNDCQTIVSHGSPHFASPAHNPSQNCIVQRLKRTAALIT